MSVSPSRSSLYNTAVRAVISAAVIFLEVFLSVQTAPAQVSRGTKVDKGPRALGLIVMPATGKPRLLPIAIMVDGQFYDASAYKASPVPMALWADTVYDAQKTGISQGLFTVSGVLQNSETKAWVAEGRFETAASLAARAAKKPAPIQPRGLNDDSGPPVLLQHSSASKPTPPDTSSSPTPTTAPTASSTSPAAGSAPASGSTPTSTAVASAPTPPSPPSSTPQQATAASTPASTPDDSSEPADPNRPALKRGKQPPRAEKPDNPTPAASSASSSSTTKPAAPSSKAAAPPPGEPQLIPAISDVGGPEPRNYAFVMKTGEEQDFQKKMLALAADDVRAREKQLAGEAVGTPAPSVAHHPASRGKSAAKIPLPNFQDIQLRVFDLTNSNDAVLVLTARLRGPQPIVRGEDAVPPKDFFVSEVAREDLNGDLHKVSSNVTDSQHLDVSPRWELIDAVDANGDGAGELLFQKFFDAGSAFAIYRVIGDQLYPIFEGTPGG